MLSTTALSLLAALALPGPSFADDSAPPIKAEVRIISFGTLQWRAPASPHMTEIGRRGASSIWAVDVAPFLDVMMKEATSHLVQLPRIVMPQNQIAEVTVKHEPDGPAVQKFSTELWKDRLRGDGLPEELVRVRIAARKIDQGTLVRLAIEEDHLLTVHTVPGAKDNAVAVAKVPEMASAAIAGEWLVPANRDLLVSLGAHTQVKKGEPVVTERLVLITVGEVKPAPADAKKSSDTAPPARPASEVTAAALDNAVDRTVHDLDLSLSKPKADAKTPMPSVPSRGLPLGFDPEGVHVPLPALPDEDKNVEPTSTSEPRPSPQARPRVGFTLPAISGDLNVQGGIDLIDPLPMPRVEAASLFSGNPVIKLGSLLFGPGTLDVDLRIGKPSRLTVAYKIGGVRLDSMLDPIDRTASKDTQVRPVSDERETYKAIHLPSLPFMEGNVPVIGFAPECPASATKAACPAAKSTCPATSAGCPDKDFCPAEKPCCQDKATCPVEKPCCQDKAACSAATNTTTSAVKPAAECAKPCEKK